MPEARKILEAQGKVREFYFELGQIEILKKSQGKLKFLNTADLKPLKARGNIWWHCNLKNVFLNKKGKFVETYQC